MTNQGISQNYSSFNPLILESRGRRQIAKQILTVLKYHLRPKKLKNLKVLDMGSSSGIITSQISRHFGVTYGIDVDKEAIDIARKNYKADNLHYEIADATALLFKSNSFDVVICNQVYECLPNSKDLMSEIFRVLKTRGICFFGARNKYTLWDGQYHLPLLAFMPKYFANLFVRVTGRAEEFISYYLSFKDLLKLCKKFKIVRYTPRIMASPNKYNFSKLYPYSKMLELFPIGFWEKVEPLLPNFIWILEKP